MPKSRTRKKPRAGQARRLDWGAPAKAGSARINAALGAIAALAVVAGGLYLWRSARSQEAFLALAAAGHGALARVETTRNFGRGHLAVGQGHIYAGPFPTSGVHDPDWVRPGFYDEPQSPTKLVHSVEHGHIVVYYEDPGEDAVALLKDWAALYDGPFQGMLAVPSSGLGAAVVLTAWRRELRLQAFDAPAAAAFIDAFRGRGPEKPVR